MYSDSPEDTADIVGMLQKKEAAKGHAFPSPLDIGDRERRVLPLYQVDSDSTWEGASMKYVHRIFCICPKNWPILDHLRRVF